MLDRVLFYQRNQVLQVLIIELFVTYIKDLQTALGIETSDQHHEPQLRKRTTPQRQLLYFFFSLDEQTHQLLIA